MSNKKNQNENVSPSDRYLQLVADLVKATDKAEEKVKKAEHDLSLATRELATAQSKGMSAPALTALVETKTEAVSKSRKALDAKVDALKKARDRGTALQEDALKRGQKFTEMKGTAEKGLKLAMADYEKAVIFEGGISFSGRARIRAIAYDRFVVEGQEVYGFLEDGDTRVRVAKAGEWTKVNATADTSRVAS